MRGSDEYTKLRLALLAVALLALAGTHGAAASTGPEAAGAGPLEGQRPAQGAGHSEPGAEQPVLHRLGAPRAGDPLVLALEVP
jgi:hypothetical protein